MFTYQADSVQRADPVAPASRNPIPFRRHRLPPPGISVLLAFFIGACSGGSSNPVIVSENPNSLPKGTLTVEPSSFLITEGEVLNLAAKLGTTSVGASQVTWSVSPSSVATIDSYGNLTAHSHGEATVTAQYTSLKGTSQGIIRAVPDALQAVSSTDPVGIVARSLSDSVGIKAVSKDGIPVPGVEVGFELQSSDGSLSHALQVTGLDGVAKTSWTLGAVAGVQQLRAHAGNLGEILIHAEALPDYDSATVVPMAGDEQEGVVATYLVEPLQAQVTDQFGNPLPGLAIEWTFESGGGGSSQGGGPQTASSKVRATTDASGMTQMRWKLGIQAGDQESVLALVGAAGGVSGDLGSAQAGTGWLRNLFKRWKARAKPSDPDAVQVTPEETWTLVAEEKLLEASLVDAFGNRIQGGIINWRVDNSGVVEVDASGKVRGVKEGRAAVFAESPSSPKWGSAWVNVLARVATSLRRHAGSGQTSPVGTRLPTPISVQVLDQAGDPVVGADVMWRVVSASSPFGGPGPSVSSASGEPTSPISFTDQDGVAETSWVLGTQAGPQILQAVVDTLPPIEFSAEASPGPAAFFTLSPAQATIKTGLTQRFSVTAEDEFGNPTSPTGITWATSDEDVAEVVGDGVVRGKSPGETVVTVEGNGTSASATLRVEVGGPAASEIVDGNQQTGVVGSTLPTPLRVFVTDAAGTAIPDIPVSWTVVAGDGSVSAEISHTGPNGVAETTWTLGPAPGEHLLEASITGLSKLTFSSSVVHGPVSSLALSPTSLDVTVGNTWQISVAAEDSFGNQVPDPLISWTSSDPGIATSDATGLVLGVSEGVTTVTAKSGGAEATVPVTVSSEVGGGGGGEGPANLELFKGTGDSQSGVVGQPLPDHLQVRVVDGESNPVEGVEVEWAVVTGGGSIDAISADTDAEGYAEAEWILGLNPGGNGAVARLDGAAQVVFSADGVAGPVAAVTVDPASASVSQGQTLQVSADAVDQYGNSLEGLTYTWSSSDAAAATVDNSGRITGVSAGTAQIRATTGGVHGGTQITVTGPPPPSAPGTVTDLSVSAVTQSSVSLRWTEVDDGTGQPASYDLRFADTPFGNGWGTATWPSVGTCNAPIAGQVVGAEITCTVEGLSAGHSYDFRVVAFRGTLNVDAVFGGLSNIVTGATEEGSPEVASVTLSPASLSLTSLGQTEALDYSILDAFGDPVSGVTLDWSSTDSSVVSVDQGGNVTSLRIGQALVILSTLCCGASDTVSVTVTQVPSTVEVSPAAMTLDVGESSNFTATVKDNLGSIIQGAEVSWTSTNPSISTVNTGGQATGVSPGSAQIRATTGSAQGTAGVTVNNVSIGEPFFSDDFEGGNLNHSENGFKWTRNVNGTVNDVNPKDGSRAYWFRFEAQSDPQNQEAPSSFSELRFDLGSLQTEVFIEYDLYIPANFSHRERNPGNNKWFLIWGSGNYPGNHVAGGPMMISTNSYRFTSGNAINYLHPVWNDADRVSGGPDAKPFITESDLGTWVRLRWHFKVSETSSSQDAVMRLWKNGSLVISKTNFNLWNGSDNGFQKGYLMGWHNSGYNQQTNLYLDNFKVYTSDPGW